MSTERNNRYKQIVEHLQEDSFVKDKAKLGLCHSWTGAAMDLLEKQYPGVKVEARAVDLELGLTHTFIRIVIDGEKPFIYDGTGVGDFEPFFGYEDQAPSHLQNSKADLINLYR